MDVDEKTDRKLGIKTTGRIDATRDVHHSAYEPTPYKVLDTLIDSQIMRKSVEENPRNIKMMFYYPSLEFVGYLTSESVIDFVDEIDLSEIYKNGDLRECIMIFTIRRKIVDEKAGICIIT